MSTREAGPGPARAGKRARARGRPGGEAILQAVVHAAAAFLKSPDWERGVPEVLRRLGLATGVSRVYVFENHRGTDGKLLVSQRYEWTAPGVQPQMGNPLLQDVPLYGMGYERWEELLSAGRIVQGPVASFPAGERSFLRSQEIRSLAVVPILAEQSWWGFMGFDDCVEERAWSPALLAILQTAADLFGAMVTRKDLEERWRRLAEATTEGILLHDGSTILDGNQRLAQLVGRPLEEVIGRSPFDFLAPEFREFARAHARDDRADPYEVRVVRRDGSQFPAELQGRTLRYRGEDVRVVAVRDLTLRKNAEENERRLLLEQDARRDAEAAERRAEFLAEASRVLASSLDTSTTLAQVAQLAVPFLADCCAVDLLEGGNLRRVATAEAGPHADRLLQVSTDEPGAGSPPDPLSERVLRGETVLILGAPPREPPSDGAPAPGSGVPASTLLLPIRSRERVVGTMSFLTLENAREPGPEDRKVAEELARRTGLALEHARLFEEAQAAVRARDEILSVVTHDLRNPLGVILGGAATLLELQPTPVQQRVVELISRNARRMDRMVDDLLEVTRMERGRLTLELRDYPTEALVGEAAAMMQPLADAQGVLLETAISDPLRPVRADAGRVIQVLSNLVGNAIKFTPAGGSVRVECVSIGEEACFMVTDTGPGISPDQIPHLFSAFWQADSADRRGLGLGLSIARGIVEAHDGRIWVESQVGVGSTFFFTLPHCEPALEPGATSPTDPASASVGRRPLL
jgi:PAS domain S-box-containing protein